MAYLLINIYTKNYWNRTTTVKIIIAGWVAYFLRHSVVMGSKSLHCVSKKVYPPTTNDNYNTIKRWV